MSPPHRSTPNQTLARADLRHRTLAREDPPRPPAPAPREKRYGRIPLELPRPKPAPTTRIPFERRIYSVEAAVTHVLSEDDQDLHVVLEDGPARLVAESPNAPFCTVNATAYRKKQMAAARDKVRICTQARIAGVVFWDRPHNVTGRANSIKLHPILDFACFS